MASRLLRPRSSLQMYHLCLARTNDFNFPMLAEIIYHLWGTNLFDNFDDVEIFAFMTFVTLSFCETQQGIDCKSAYNVLCVFISGRITSPTNVVWQIGGNLRGWQRSKSSTWLLEAIKGATCPKHNPIIPKSK